MRSIKDSFLILTDHRNLEYLMQTRQLNERQMRWAQKFSRYNYQLNHCPGNLAVTPDTLSRREQYVLEHGDDRLQQAMMKLLPNWDETVQSCPMRIDRIMSQFQDDEPTQLWNLALELDESFAEIKKVIQLTVIQWSVTLKIRGLGLSQCTINNQEVVHRSGKLWIPNF